LVRIGADGRADVVDAGHGQCWIARADGAVEAVSLQGHPPIGVLPDARHVAERLLFAAGERWIVATDGYSESLADPVVRDACRDLLARPANAADTLSALRRLAHRGDDDASLLVLRFGNQDRSVATR
ncbi:MAG TPA: SpoIIE family protein phosphatase, partial [Polyangiaceae bacterium]|nr:SpoIIE family protein phosphatase [Polyangiaceae bacterium]